MMIKEKVVAVLIRGETVIARRTHETKSLFFEPGRAADTIRVMLLMPAVEIFRQPKKYYLL